MVKNQSGGSRAKSFARKNEQVREKERLRLSECDEEVYACVTKVYGGGMCAITTITGQNLLGHIRKKFSGRGKRTSMVGPNTVVLVGMRHWESTAKNCDILEVYSVNEVEQLKTIPKVGFERLQQFIITGPSTGEKTQSDDVAGFDIGMGDYDDVGRDEEKGELEDVKVDEFTLENGDEICIDDI